MAHELLATRFPVPREEIEATLLRDAQWHGELRHRTRDGRIIHVASHWALQRTARGQPEAVAEVNNDITGQRRAEDALLRLAAIVASSNDAIIGMTLDGTITDWNDAATTLFGYKEEEVVGRPITILYPTERIGEEAALLQRLRQGEPVQHFETARRRRNGETFPVSVNLSPILDANGVVIGASKIVRDLSETVDRDRRLTEAQAEIMHMSRLSELGQLVSALVHEVNQPLAAISNYTQAIQRLLNAGTAERVPLALEKIAEQTERAYQIIRRLREFVRKGETRRQPEHLSKIVEESIALSAIGPAARGAAIHTAFAPDVDLVQTDRVQIEQVLFNLLRNALEAMQDLPRARGDGRRRIGGRRDGGCQRNRPRPRPAEDRAPETVPAVRDDQAHRHGGGPFGLPRHYRGAWRGVVGLRQSRRRHGIPFHPPVSTTRSTPLMRRYPPRLARQVDLNQSAPGRQACKRTSAGRTVAVGLPTLRPIERELTNAGRWSCSRTGR